MSSMLVRFCALPLLALVYHRFVSKQSKQCTLKNATDPITMMIAVARRFDKRATLYAVWGTCCLSYHGVPTVLKDVTFVIPDPLFDTAVEDLQNHPFLLLCPGNCEHYNLLIVKTSIPPIHLMHTTTNIRVVLWKQSQVMPMVDLNDNSKDIVAASPRRVRSFPTTTTGDRYLLSAVETLDPFAVRYLSASTLTYVSLVLAVRDIDEDRLDVNVWLQDRNYAIQYFPGAVDLAHFPMAIQRAHIDLLKNPFKKGSILRTAKRALSSSFSAPGIP